MNKQDAEQASVQPSYNCTPRALDSQHRGGQQPQCATFDSFATAQCVGAGPHIHQLQNNHYMCYCKF